MNNNEQQPNFDDILTDMTGKSIRGHRLNQGLTQAQLAEKSGLNTEHINQIERGKKQPKLGTFIKICYGLGYKETLFNEIVSTVEQDLIKDIENKDKD